MALGRIRIARHATVVICLSLLVASFVDYLAGQRERSSLVELLREAGFASRDDDVLDRVRHERTSHHAQILTARALLYDVLDTRHRAGTNEGEPTLSGGRAPVDEAAWNAAVDRLEVAAGLAREVLRAQPNSWQASMLLGAAIYLERSIRRDPLLYTEHRDWEEPLRWAFEAAPGQAEPRRFLVTAYLELWPALSSEKKNLTRELLRTAFNNDDSTFASLLPVWLEVAENADVAFAAIPERSIAWRAIEGVFAARHQWPVFVRARARLEEALLAENEARLAEAEARLRLGELFHSRSLLLQVVATSPLDLRFAPLVTRAIERYPPGLHGLSSTEPLRRWLSWALELAVLDLLPLPPKVISRLAGAVGDLDPPERALAALVGGEIHHAERLELLTDSISTESWGPYLLSKARFLLSRDQVGEAASLLELVDRTTRRSALFALRSEEVARARAHLAELARAERELAAFRKSEWSAAEWRIRSSRASVRILPEFASQNIGIQLNRVPANGAVIEVFWDGERRLLQPVTEDGELELALAVTTKLHLLEIRTVAGGQLFPGRVRLL